MIVPENRKKTYQFRMTVFVFKILTVIFVILSLLFILGVVMGGKYLNLYVEYKTLIAQNKNLNNQLEKVRQLEFRLKKVEEIELFLNNLLSGENKSTKNHENIVSTNLLTNFSSNSIVDPQARYKFIPRGLPQKGFITTEYGERGRMYNDDHRGIDIALPAGKPVYSTGAGRVVFSGYDSELGLSVTIDHLNGYITKYGHLSRLHITTGRIIDRNSIIGFSGQSGRSIGSHIHYVVMKDGEIVDPIANNTYISEKESSSIVDSI